MQRRTVQPVLKRNDVDAYPRARTRARLALRVFWFVLAALMILAFRAPQPLSIFVAGALSGVALSGSI